MAKAPGIIEDGLGSFLRQEREARGIPLGDVAKQTRVRNFYLECIEAGEYSRLPCVPIARGFVRAYAGAIGVDAEAAARQFDREFGTAQQQMKAAQFSAEKIAFSQIAERPSGQKLWLPFAAVVVLIVVSGVLFWALRGKTEEYVPVTSFSERLKAAAGPMLRQMPQILSPAKSKPVPPVRTPPVRTPAAEPQSRNPVPAEGDGVLSVSAAKRNGENGLSGLPAASAVPGTVASAPPETASARPPAAETPVPPSNAPPSRPAVVLDSRLALKIRALEDTWVRIVVDQREIQEFLLTAGNERFWKGSERFILTVGNVAGTQVSLNGSRIVLPQSSSNVVRDFVITEKLLN